mgnify:CR=1 FL=1
MAIRKIREIGDEVLTKVCKEVTKMTPRTTELIDDMLETMYEAMGVGLAAPQVGILKRIVVIDIGEGPVVMINPRIVESRPGKKDVLVCQVNPVLLPVRIM